ncbi:hypothetical protein QR680_004262 [Steinernema hermaphroditum]|uniref:RING-type domain-containing protein n=1 Tax=Steinernema hermaphroditum TaxID=289476 RepID=A0AA39LTF3_9BILA|nr:hypothetical protein QR680_004262 [Steinernema hermaphroditum]
MRPFAALAFAIKENTIYFMERRWPHVRIFNFHPQLRGYLPHKNFELFPLLPSSGSYEGVITCIDGQLYVISYVHGANRWYVAAFNLSANKNAATYSRQKTIRFPGSLCSPTLWRNGTQLFCIKNYETYQIPGIGTTLFCDKRRGDERVELQAHNDVTDLLFTSRPMWSHVINDFAFVVYESFQLLKINLRLHTIKNISDHIENRQLLSSQTPPSLFSSDSTAIYCIVSNSARSESWKMQLVIKLDISEELTNDHESATLARNVVSNVRPVHLVHSVRDIRPSTSRSSTGSVGSPSQSVLGSRHSTTSSSRGSVGSPSQSILGSRHSTTSSSRGSVGSLSFPTCSICYIDFNEPKVFPCGHSVCESCENQLRQHAQGSNSLACPVCRSAAPLRSDQRLPVNYVLKEVLGIVKNRKSN